METLIELTEEELDLIAGGAAAASIMSINAAIDAVSITSINAATGTTASIAGGVTATITPSEASVGASFSVSATD